MYNCGSGCDPQSKVHPSHCVFQVWCYSLVWFGPIRLNSETAIIGNALSDAAHDCFSEAMFGDTSAGDAVVAASGAEGWRCCCSCLRS